MSLERERPRVFLIGALMSALLISQPLHAETLEELPWDALQTRALLLYRQKRYPEALDAARHALRLSERQTGNESLQTAQSSRLLAQLYVKTRQFPQALHAYQRALALFEHWLGPLHQQIADTLILIAEFYDGQGSQAKAEPVYERARVAQEAVVGSAHPKLAETLILIARFYEGHGALSNAEPLYERALQIHETALDPRDPQMLETLIIVADFYRAHGREEQARPLYELARVVQLQSAQRDDSPSSPSTPKPLNTVEGKPRLRTVETGRRDAAPRAVDRVDDANLQAAAQRSPPTLLSSSGSESEPQTRRQFLKKLAASSAECSAVYLSLGANEEGERLFQEAFGIYREMYGPDLSKTREAFYLDVQRLRQAGKSEEAYALETRARKL